jgi:hypothetical protein
MRNGFLLEESKRLTENCNELHSEMELTHINYNILCFIHILKSTKVRAAYCTAEEMSFLFVAFVSPQHTILLNVFVGSKGKAITMNFPSCGHQ